VTTQAVAVETTRVAEPTGVARADADDAGTPTEPASMSAATPAPTT